jgi:hypothetical protein
VTLNPGEEDIDNDFFDSENGSISGTVTDDQGNILSNVKITLETSTETDIQTTVTDSIGKYIFASVIEPGQYFVVLEEHPAGYPSNISEQDSTPANSDVSDSNTAVGNCIPVA